MGARFLDVDGRVRVIGDETGPGGFGFVFVSDGCQNSMIYAAELSALAAQAQAQGIDLYAVLTSPRLTWSGARRLRDELDLKIPTLFDPTGELTNRLGVEVTPTAVLISADDQMVYRGRVDDRFVGLGQRRTVIRSHDLQDAIARVAQGDLRGITTEPVGCWVEDRRPPGERELSYFQDIAPPAGRKLLKLPPAERLRALPAGHAGAGNLARLDDCRCYGDRVYAAVEGLAASGSISG